MTEKEREQEIFNRIEKRERLKARFEIEKKLRQAKKKRESKAREEQQMEKESGLKDKSFTDVSMRSKERKKNLEGRQDKKSQAIQNLRAEREKKKKAEEERKVYNFGSFILFIYRFGTTILMFDQSISCRRRKTQKRTVVQHQNAIKIRTEINPIRPNGTRGRNLRHRIFTQMMTVMEVTLLPRGLLRSARRRVGGHEARAEVDREVEDHIAEAEAPAARADLLREVAPEAGPEVAVVLQILRRQTVLPHVEV